MNELCKYLFNVFIFHALLSAVFSILEVLDIFYPAHGTPISDDKAQIRIHLEDIAAGLGEAKIIKIAFIFIVMISAAVISIIKFTHERHIIEYLRDRWSKKQ